MSSKPPVIYTRKGAVLKIKFQELQKLLLIQSQIRLKVPPPMMMLSTMREKVQPAAVLTNMEECFIPPTRASTEILNENQLEITISL